MKEEEIQNAKLAGLTYIGDDEYSDPQFMGSDEQWADFEKMQEIYYAENAY